MPFPLLASCFLKAFWHKMPELPQDSDMGRGMDHFEQSHPVPSHPTHFRTLSCAHSRAHAEDRHQRSVGRGRREAQCSSRALLYCIRYTAWHLWGSIQTLILRFNWELGAMRQGRNRTWVCRVLLQNRSEEKERGRNGQKAPHCASANLLQYFWLILRTDDGTTAPKWGARGVS